MEPVCGKLRRGDTATPDAESKRARADLKRSTQESRMKKQVTYSDEARKNALEALEQNKGNIYQTAKETGISRDTILRWAREREHALRETPMDKRLEEIAQKIVRIMPEKVEGASLQELARVLPVVLSTLKEMQSNREDDGVDVRQKLADLLAHYAGRRDAIGHFERADEGARSDRLG